MSTQLRIDAGRQAVFSRLANEKDGNFAIVTAVVIPFCIMTAGIAIDLSMTFNAKAELQTVIDSAALAGVIVYDGTNPEEAEAEARKFLDAAGPSLPAQMSYTITPGTDKATLTVTGTGTVRTSLMQIANITTIPVAATATALRPLKPIAATFTADDANGWYYKVITVRVVRPGSSAEETISTITYTPKTRDGGGSGTMKVSPKGETSLGDYTKLVLQMDIKYDSCPLGTVYQGGASSSFTCRNSSTAGALRYDNTLRTDDPKTSDHIFIDGVQRAINKALDYTELLNCSGQQQHSWEDQVNVTLSDSRDFFYTVKPKCVFDDGALRLTQ